MLINPIAAPTQISKQKGRSLRSRPGGGMLAFEADPTGRIDVLLSLEDAERKDIRRQVLEKTPVDPEHLVISRAAAVQLRKNLATQLIWMASGVLVMVIGALFVVRDFRQAGRFLDRTTEPGVTG